jgi:hypothetical protein
MGDLLHRGMNRPSAAPAWAGVSSEGRVPTFNRSNQTKVVPFANVHQFDAARVPPLYDGVDVHGKVKRSELPLTIRGDWSARLAYREELPPGRGRVVCASGPLPVIPDSAPGRHC